MACSPTESLKPRRCVQALLRCFRKVVALLTASPPQVCYLMPSSSPRCAQFPRAQDKVHFYIKLKELRDQMKGVASGSDVQETQYSFDLQLAKGSARLTSLRLEWVTAAMLLCLQTMPRGWPSKRSSTIPSMRAAAGSSGLTPPPERSGEECLQQKPGTLMKTSVPHSQMMDSTRELPRLLECVHV